MLVSAEFVAATVPSTVVVPLAALLSLAFVRADDPFTVVVPAALDVSAALVTATVPVQAFPTDPDALLVSAAFVVADEPTTVVVPLADDVSLALVFADVPVIVVVPEALLVSFALVVADVPVDPLANGARNIASSSASSNSCQRLFVSSLASADVIFPRRATARFPTPENVLPVGNADEPNMPVNAGEPGQESVAAVPAYSTPLTHVLAT